MRPTISLEVTSPSGAPGRIEGFRFLWAFYVRGYHPDVHCQRCFRGRRVAEFSTATARAGVAVALDRMDRYPYVYVCGVGAGPRTALRQQNLHFPLRYAPGRATAIASYNGYLFRAQNAERLEIPELPAGWEGKAEEHVRCKNFQFAVASFGYPSRDGQGDAASPAG